MLVLRDGDRHGTVSKKCLVHGHCPCMQCNALAGRGLCRVESSLIIILSCSGEEAFGGGGIYPRLHFAALSRLSLRSSHGQWAVFLMVSFARNTSSKHIICRPRLGRLKERPIKTSPRVSLFLYSHSHLTEKSSSRRSDVK